MYITIPAVICELYLYEPVKSVSPEKQHLNIGMSDALKLHLKTKIAKCNRPLISIWIDRKFSKKRKVEVNAEAST